MNHDSRRGFVLVSVLWFLTGVAVLAMAAMFKAREGLATSHNRIELIRAHWRAEDCIARSFAVMDAASGGVRVGSHDRQGPLDYSMVIRESALVSDCDGAVTLEPVGRAVDINAASEMLLTRVLVNQGVPEASADSLVAALLDWRDADDSARGLGAERGWYAGRGEIGPRNAHLADVEELRLVRGFDAWMRSTEINIAAVLTTEPGRVLLGAAPASVVAALPGLSFAGAIALEDHLNNAAAPLPELLALVGVVPEQDRATLISAMAELGTVAVVRPDAWILRAMASGDHENPHATRSIATIDLRLVPDGRRFAVVRRRLTP